MQTIKTAAIVVLMLTVLYGGYVSLTTPPEPLPDEIEEVLVIEESDSAFEPDSALAHDLQLGEPPAGVLPAAETAELSDAPSAAKANAQAATASTPSPQASSKQPQPASPPSPLAAKDPGAAEASTAQVAAGQPAGKQPADKPPSTEQVKTFGASFADSPRKSEAAKSTATASPQRATGPKPLPRVTNDAGPEVTPQPASSYAATPNKFKLPDPQQAAASFDASKGAAFREPAQEDTADRDFQISDARAEGTAVESLGDKGGDSEQTNRGLANALTTADALYAKGQLKEALATLSVFYDMPGLSEAERTQLLSRLDPLARDVIYSRRHLLEQPHRVTANETLMEIAKEYEVPWQLLANVNGVDDPVTVLPGTELKMIRGPFRAEVNLTAKQMTLFLGDLYAGRFEVALGNDPAPETGSFTIQEKRDGKDYYGPAGITVEAGDPENPYGDMWLDLGGQLCIHGSPNTVQATEEGCISVAGDYADDVYGILSRGSTVTIRR